MMAWPTKKRRRTRPRSPRRPPPRTRAPWPRAPPAGGGRPPSVARMDPDPYSALMSSTPSTPMASCPKRSPVRLTLVGSNSAPVDEAGVAPARGLAGGGEDADAEAEHHRGEHAPCGGADACGSSSTPSAGRPEAVVPGRERPGAGRRSRPSVPDLPWRRPGAVLGPELDASWVSSMNASSSEAAWGANSCRAMPSPAARSPIAAAASPVDDEGAVRLGWTRGPGPAMAAAAARASACVPGPKPASSGPRTRPPAGRR